MGVRDGVVQPVTIIGGRRGYTTQCEERGEEERIAYLMTSNPVGMVLVGGILPYDSNASRPVNFMATITDISSICRHRTGGRLSVCHRTCGRCGKHC